MKSVLEKCLPFIHVNDVKNFDVEQAVLDLRKALADIHECLEEFRYHEGRELLVNEMASQLENIKLLEAELQRYSLYNFSVLL